MATKVYTDLDFQNVGKVKGLPTPVNPGDAVNKDYVDGLATGAPATLNDIGDVSTTPVDKSVLYYDAATSTYKADSTWTINSIVDGGNF